MATSEARKRAVAKYRLKHPDRVKAISSKYYDANKAAIRTAQNTRKREGRTDEKARIGLILDQARTRAGKKGFEFTIDRSWLAGEIAAQDGRCAMSGVKFEYVAARFHPWTPSLDRIKPEEGYTPANTRVVCWMWNSAKGLAKDAQVIEFARAVMEKWGTMPAVTNASTSED